MTIKIGDYSFTKTEKGYLVSGSESGEIYVINDRMICSCLGSKFRGRCKHLEMLKEVVVTSQTKKPYEEIFSVYKNLCQHLYKIPTIQNFLCAGSLRRKAQFVKDIDMVVVGKFSSFLYDIPDLQIIESGQSLIRFNYQNVHVDVRFSRPENLGAMMLTLTGPKEFNIFMRSLAKNRGMKLNEYGLYVRDTNELICGENEWDIFQALDLKYIQPENRR